MEAAAPRKEWHRVTAEGAASPTITTPATVEELTVMGEGATMVFQERGVDKTESATVTAPRLGLSKTEAMPLVLTEKMHLAKDVALYRFEFAMPDMVLGLRVKSIVVLKAPVGDMQEDGTREVMSRPYSPISRPDVQG
jgi:hypothetical protein